MVRWDGGRVIYQVPLGAIGLFMGGGRTLLGGVGGRGGSHDLAVHARVSLGSDGEAAVAVDVAIVQGSKLWGRWARGKLVGGKALVGLESGMWGDW